MAAASLPPLRHIAGALRQATGRLTAELAQPRAAAPDWNTFEWDIARAVAAIHGISVLLARRLTWRGPPRWERFLERQVSQGEKRDRRIGELLAGIDTATRRENVAVIALKGSALRTLGLYQPAERPMGDIDLLARAHDFPAVTRALRALGYHEAFCTRRHSVFVDRAPARDLVLGEHIDSPLKIELHARISEPLPVTRIDITTSLLRGAVQPGVNAYADRVDLLRHLLLHAAGSMRVRALRLVHLEDIARLTRDFDAADWQRLIEPPDSCWWALPPLLLARDCCRADVPAQVEAALDAAGPRSLRRAARRHSLTDLSLSDPRIVALPGIEWSRSWAELLRYTRHRLAPGAAARHEVALVTAAQPQMAAMPWYTQSPGVRLLRWAFCAPLRVETMTTVLSALVPDGDECAHGRNA